MKSRVEMSVIIEMVGMQKRPHERTCGFESIDSATQLDLAMKRIINTSAYIFPYFL